MLDGILRGLSKGICQYKYCHGITDMGTAKGVVLSRFAAGGRIFPSPILSSLRRAANVASTVASALVKRISLGVPWLQKTDALDLDQTPLMIEHIAIKCGKSS